MFAYSPLHRGAPNASRVLAATGSAACPVPLHFPLDEPFRMRAQKDTHSKAAAASFTRHISSAAAQDFLKSKRSALGRTAGILPCGTTGESPTLTDEETRKVIKTVVDKAAKRCQVIGGGGSNCTKKAVAAAQMCKALPPPGGGPRAQGCREEQAGAAARGVREG